MLLELLKIVPDKSFAWISDIKGLSILDFIKNNKVVLIPVENCRMPNLF